MRYLRPVICRTMCGWYFRPRWRMRISQSAQRRAFSCFLPIPTLLLLSACSGNEPVTPIDTSCDRFAHISATDAQVEVFKTNWAVMESYADQVISHNIEFDKRCLGLPPVKRT